jgi:hypothetical protein
MGLPASILFAVATLAQAPFQTPPMPTITKADCSVDDRLSTGRWSVELRNEHDQPLVAWWLEFIDPVRPHHVGRSGTDRVLQPSSYVRPGQTVEHRSPSGCASRVSVAVAVFADGGSAGDARDVFLRRREQLQRLQHVLATLRTSPLGDDGANGLVELESLLDAVVGPDGLRAKQDALGAVSALEDRPDILNLLRRDHLSKDQLVAALERAVTLLERAEAARR